MKTQIFGINLKRRTIGRLSAFGGTDEHRRTKTKPELKKVIVRGGLSILVVLMLSYSLVSCVETAECDETVACVDGNVCYDLKCQSACIETSDCRDTETCEPCLENFGAGISDHCFTDSRLACIVQEVKDE